MTYGTHVLTCDIRGNMSSRHSSDSEANASELLENLEDIQLENVSQP